MRPSLTMFLNLPMPVKAALLVVSGGGMMALIYFLMMFNIFKNATGYVLLVIFAVVAFASVVYGVISKKLQKRKSKPFERKVAESSATAPQGVSDPGSRAKLDDLRKKFDEGIQVFKEHGKDLYTMPWYVIVGEPGSGKTEAMRHSNVGFPPGLQNQLQGVGGTVNMHWWFTNQAVMIDTAGRLMFEEVEPGQTSEWTEFLKMLRSARPNCPLNGMLLVIPADSLIKDTANDIERKGSKIAQQLDQIQRALGVRFPVFVLISKADRINGFREFFDELTDPVAAMQMMGWSNPNDLDTPFDPSMVEEHLRSVRERLVRRRFALLADPVHTEDPMGRRIDQVDALYAFPDSLVKLAPRLRRYLEMVFVAGEWSQKPLFLRGIYFTSSMREGDALDADLADVLGVQVDALKEGKLWERERSYFLKDVFMEKVFRERGLVTRESNVGKSRRRQSFILMVAVALAAGLIGLWTWYGLKQLDRTVARYSGFWAGLREEIRNSRSGISWIMAVEPTRGNYQDGNVKAELQFEWTGPGGRVIGERTRLAMQETAFEHAQQVAEEDPTPLIFSVVGAATSDVSSRLPRAQRALFEVGVVESFCNEARRRMSSANGSGVRREWWNEATVDALAALLEIQGLGLGGPPEPGSIDYQALLQRLGYLTDATEADLGSRKILFQGAKGPIPATWERFKDDLPRLGRIFTGVFEGSGKVDVEELRKAFGCDSEEARLAVVRGVDSLIEHWEPGSGDGQNLLTLVNSFNDLIQEFDDSERAVLEFTGFNAVKTRTGFEAARSEWLSRLDRLAELKASLDDLLNTSVTVEDEPVTFGVFLTGAREAELKSKTRAAATAQIEAVFDRLINAIPVLGEEGDKPEEYDSLVALRGKLVDRRDEWLEGVNQDVEDAFDADRRAMRERVVARVPGSDPVEYVYAQRFVALSAVREAIQRSVDVTDINLFKLGDWVTELDSALSAIRPSGDDLVVCQKALDGYLKYAATQGVDATLRALSEQAASIEGLVASEAADHDALLLGLDGLQLVYRGDGGASNPNAVPLRFHPEAAAELFKSKKELNERMSGEGLLDRTLLEQRYNAGGVKQKLDAYRAAYWEYWGKTVPDLFAARAVSNTDATQDWPQMHSQLNELRTSDVCRSLGASTELVLKAIEALKIDAGADAAELSAYEAKLNEDVARLTGELRDRALTMRDRWWGLSADASQAVQRLRAALRDSGKFRDEFLGTVERDAAQLTPARRYWHSYAVACLQALNSSHFKQADVDKRFVIGQAKGIPIMRGGDELSVEVVRSVAERVGRLVVQHEQSDSNGGSAGVPNLPGEVSEMLEQVSGERPLFSQTERAWLEKVSAVTRSLMPKDGGLMRLSIVFPSIEGQSDHPNIGFLRSGNYVRVRRGGQAFAGGSYTVDRGGEQRIAELPIPDESGEAIEFLFYESQQLAESGSAPIARGVLPMPWHGLSLYLRAASEPQSAGGVRLVEIARDKRGNPYYIGVKLPDGLPGWNDWPSESDWPR